MGGKIALAMRLLLPNASAVCANFISNVRCEPNVEWMHGVKYKVVGAVIYSTALYKRFI